MEQTQGLIGVSVAEAMCGGGVRVGGKGLQLSGWAATGTVYSFASTDSPGAPMLICPLNEAFAGTPNGRHSLLFGILQRKPRNGKKREGRGHEHLTHLTQRYTMYQIHHLCGNARIRESWWTPREYAHPSQISYLVLTHLPVVDSVL